MARLFYYTLVACMEVLYAALCAALMARKKHNARCGAYAAPAPPARINRRCLNRIVAASAYNDVGSWRAWHGELVRGA